MTSESLDVSTVEKSSLVGQSTHGRNDSSRGERWRLLTYRILLGVSLLAVWQFASGSRYLPTYEVSNPRDVWISLWQLLQTRAGWQDIQTTLIEIIFGFLLGVGIGVAGGLILGGGGILGRVCEPFIAALNSIPKIALAPLFLLFFGIGEMSKITLSATMVAFVVFYNLYYGMKTVRVELVNLVRLMGGRRRDVLRYVTLPSLVSPFFAGLKAGAPLTVIGVVIGEFLVSFNGIGHLMLVDGNDLDASGVFAGIVILVIVSLIINGIITSLDAFASRKLGLSPKRAGSLSRL